MKGANAELKAKRDANALDRGAMTELRKRWTFESRMAAQRVRQDREVTREFQDRMRIQRVNESETAKNLKAQSQADARLFRDRMTFTNSMFRQRERERAAQSRDEASAAREGIRLDRYRMTLREREERRLDREVRRMDSERAKGWSQVSSGARSAGEGSRRSMVGAGVITAATAATAGSAARRGISTRMEVDTAETNLRIFSGQTNDQIKAARKGFLDNEAIRNGLGIKGGLDAYSEVLKTGMASPAENTKTIMRAVSALELDLKDTTKLAGLIDRNYGASSTPAKIKSALNAIAVAAREDPTQSNEIVEGVKRSFGALSTGNLTPEQLTAMVSGGQSVGIQPGKAGTFVATMAKQLSMGSSKFLGKKNRAELDFAARELGFGNSRSLAQTYSKDSYGTMMSVHENLAAMEAAKRTQVAEAFYGRQWSDEGLQMAQGVGGVRKTFGEISDGKNSNFLDEAARQRSESLLGQWNSTKSIFNMFWDAFGSGFEDILTSINKYFLDLNSSFDYDKIKSYVVSFFDGVKDALGVKTWTELLQNTFGGNLGNYGQQIREFARGFTEGVLAIVRSIRSVFTAFAGSNASAEQIGNWTGKFLAFAAACIVSAPAIAVLTGLATAIAGLATVALASWRILRAAGVVGATGLGSNPKAPTSTPGSGAVGRLGGLGIAGAAAGFAGSASLSKGESDALSRRLGEWAKDREKQSVPPSAVDELREAIQDNTLLHRQSFEQEKSLGGLIHRASLSGEAVRSSLQGPARSVMSGTLGTVGALNGGPLSNSTPGSALGPTGLGGRGIIGGRGAAPGGGGGFGGGGTGTILKGEAVGNAKIAYDFFRSKGLSHEAASGILGKMKHESNFNPNARGDGGKAHGLFQHHADRRAAILRGSGVDMSNASVQDQLKGVWWEMNHGDAGAQRALRDLKTPGITAGQAGHTFGKNFERPAEQHLRWRGKAGEEMAVTMAGGGGSGGGGGAAVPGKSSDVAGRINALRASGAITNEQCVALAKAYVGVSGSVTSWRKGDAAQAGTLKPGTPIATFLNRNGSQSDRYAGGGTGTMGAGTDHAAVFTGYIRDKNGNITGMNVAEQYKGSGGVKSKQYNFGSGFGEKNASNYNAIKGPDGSYLGGKNNPMNGSGEALAQQETLRSSGWKKAGDSSLGSSDELKSSGWQKGLGANAPLGGGVPLKGSNIQSASSGMGRGGGGGSAGGSPISITMNHQGSDPQAIANAVQRRLQDSMNRRSHDLDPSSISGIG
ncbi:phage tail tip lysozyme [Methylobacterium sp. WL69]|uniref:phage tail tip lysozyme n=1 Tax=Methylobacterium sp. WL69 TaxID=2603893 RepID=UPI0016501DF9|nr:phage tail tip lysozyme [Methylobacterium sp. WL69]